MKKQTMKKFISLLLCAALLLSLSACGKMEVSPVLARTTRGQQETLPSAAQTYAQASSQLDASESLKLQNEITMITVAGSDTITEEYTQTLELQGRNTKRLSARISESCDYGETAENLEEVYIGGVLYSNLNGFCYQTQFSPEEFADYIFPAVLLTAELYNVVEWEDEDTLCFSEPAGPEEWMDLDEESFTQAEGSVDFDEEGQIVQSFYHVRFSRGTAEIDLSITSTVEEPDTAKITAPEDPESYAQLPDPYVPQMLFRAGALCYKCSAISFEETENFFMLDMTYGADNGFMTQTFSYDCCGDLPDLVANMDAHIVITSSYYGETCNSIQNEHFENGVYTFTMDGETEQDEGITALDMRIYYQDEASAIPRGSDFAEYTLTDLGGSYLIEYEKNVDMQNLFENYIQYNLFSNEFFLDDLSEQVSVEEGERRCTGYVGIDKATGLPTCASMSYSADYIIDGVNYTLGYESIKTLNMGSPWIAQSISETEPVPDESLPAPTPLFYHVTGKKGEELWLMGTIHVGDSRTGRLPQEIYDALADADALAVEFDGDEFLAQMESDPELADEVFQAYVYTDGSMGSDHVQDQEMYENAIKLMKAAGQYTNYCEYMRLFLLSQTIENFYLRQGYSLSADYGVDAQLMKLAAEQGKPILNVESGQQQLQMFSSLSDELQELLLSDTVYNGQAEYNRQNIQLFELWCSGDESALTEAVNRDLSAMTEEEKDLYEENRELLEEYDQAVITQRNAGMLDVALSYLNGRQTVFYAVGLAHLLSEDGLVQGLRDAGYTVELVSFA